MAGRKRAVGHHPLDQEIQVADVFDRGIHIGEADLGALRHVAGGSGSEDPGHGMVVIQILQKEPPPVTCRYGGQLLRIERNVDRLLDLISPPLGPAKETIASGDHADPVQPQVAQLCLGIPIGIEWNYGQAP